MIETKELLFAIDMGLNKNSSLQNQAIPVPTKIIALNNAILKVLSSKINVNNIYQAGFQSFLSRISELETLVVRDEKQEAEEQSGIYKTYRVSTSKLAHPIYMPLSLTGVANRGKCNGRKIVAPRLNKHADIPMLISDSHYCPSFRFQETLATYQEGNIDMYVGDPEGEFTIEDMYISYLRYPNKVDIEGYTHFNGTASTNKDCELPMSLKDDIVTVAIMELAISTGNIEIVQPLNNINDKYQ